MTRLTRHHFDVILLQALTAMQSFVQSVGLFNQIKLFVKLLFLIEMPIYASMYGI